MRVAAIATLAFGLVMAALWVALGAPSPALAVGPTQAVDVVTIRMVNNNQPESVFPQGTTVVNGVVNYNIRGEDNNPISRKTTISVTDPVGLEVYSKTFQTSASYTGTATEPFSVSGDQMMAVYKATATTQSQKAANDAQAIGQATNQITSDMLNSVSAVQYSATQAQKAAEQITTFAEVPSDVKAVLTLAAKDLGDAAESANAIVTAGACTPNSQGCDAKVVAFNQNLQTIKDKTQSGATGVSTAVAQLTGLSNLAVPLTNKCGGTQNDPVPTEYTSTVLQVLQANQPPTPRDTWAWQVGNPSFTPINATVTASPSKIYTNDVTVTTVHSSQIRGVVRDVQCLPVPDGIPVTFTTNNGQLTSTSAQTTSSGGLHGLVSTTLQAGNDPGNATVRITGLFNQGASVTIIGQANSIHFQTSSGQSSIVIQRGAATNLQVLVTDIRSSAVADGTPVQFTVTENAGTFSPTSATTVNGIAQTTFTAGTSATTATITAQVPGTSATTQLQVIFVGDPATITLSVPAAYSTTLYLNSDANYTYVEATVKDDQGNPVADGTPVEFRLLAAGKAVWDQPSDSEGILTNVITTNGKARAKLTAKPNAIPSGQTSTTVGVVAGVPGTSVQIPPFQAVEITITNRQPPVYKIYLPSILKRALCGRPNGGGCSAREPVQ